jgi:hypothetical protein
MAAPHQITAGVNAVALGFTGGGSRLGLHNQGLRGKATPLDTTGPLEATGAEAPPLTTPCIPATNVPASILKAGSLPAATFTEPAFTGAAFTGAAISRLITPLGATLEASRRSCGGTALVGVAAAGAAIPFTLGTTVEGTPLETAARAITPGLPAWLLSVRAPFRLRTAEPGRSTSPAASPSGALVRTALESWAHGVSRRLWIVLLQVI